MPESKSLLRRLVAVVLEQAQKVGLDAAGSFLGPAWPLVKPVVEALLKDLPEGITNRLSNGDDALQKAIAELETRDEQLALIAEALAKQGVTEAMTASWVDSLEALSDGQFQLLRQVAHGRAELGELRELVKQSLAMAAEKPALLKLIGQQLEYIDLLRVPGDFLPGFDLAPHTFAIDSIGGRHTPAGFMVWTFSLVNAGGKRAVLYRFDLEVTAEGACPRQSVYDQLKPTLALIEERVELASATASYRLFKGKKFAYEPDESDAFRVQIIFADPGPPRWQRLRPVLHWHDADEERVTLGPELVLASHPKPQLELARHKLGLSYG